MSGAALNSLFYCIDRGFSTAQSLPRRPGCALSAARARTGRAASSARPCPPPLLRCLSSCFRALIASRWRRPLWLRRAPSLAGPCIGPSTPPAIAGGQRSPLPRRATSAPRLQPAPTTASTLGTRILITATRQAVKHLAVNRTAMSSAAAAPSCQAVAARNHRRRLHLLHRPLAPRCLCQSRLAHL